LGLGHGHVCDCTRIFSLFKAEDIRKNKYMVDNEENLNVKVGPKLLER